MAGVAWPGWDPHPQPLTCARPRSGHASSSPPSPWLIFRPKLQPAGRRQAIGGAGEGPGPAPTPHLSQRPTELPPPGTGSAGWGHPEAPPPRPGDAAIPVQELPGGHGDGNSGCRTPPQAPVGQERRYGGIPRHPCPLPCKPEGHVPASGQLRGAPRCGYRVPWGRRGTERAAPSPRGAGWVPGDVLRTASRARPFLCLRGFNGTAHPAAVREPPPPPRLGVTQGLRQPP